MNDMKFARVYQTLFQAYSQLDDNDEKELEISFLIFDAMNKMQEYWGDE